MLDVALKFLAGEVSTYLFAVKGAESEDLVKLTRLVDESGKYALSEGSLAMTLINIEEERNFKSHLPEAKYVNGQHTILEPELKLNLHILFAAHFRDYDQALKVLSSALTYFQAHHSFTPEEYPALDVRIPKLVVELQSPTYEQLNQVWGFIGAKQLPSAIYKVRLVVLQDESLTAIQPPLTTINATLRTR
jgi:hypothetical protein